MREFLCVRLKSRVRMKMGNEVACVRAGIFLSYDELNNLT